MKLDTVKLEEFLNAYADKNKIPGMAVCLTGPEGTIYKKGFGFRDIGRTLPVESDTIFGIASMSKSVTCTAVALLEHEGKLCIDEPISRYIPEFRIPGTPREMLLIRHLMNHTTGLPPTPLLSWCMLHHTPLSPWLEKDKDKMEAARASAPAPMATVEQMIEYIANSGDYTPLGEPGEYMSYSNDCYAVLSRLVDIVAGESFESYIQKKLFDPLGMTRTTLDTELAKSKGNITSLFGKNGEELMATDEWDVAPPYRGCGWIKSTAEDMCKYYEMLSCRGEYRGKRIVPESCVERVIGREFPELKTGMYCFGLNKRTFKDVVLCEHSGGLTGVSSNGGFIKDKGYAVTVLTNLGGVNTSVILSAMYNTLLGLPVDTSHAAYEASGTMPECPEVFAGKYGSKESMEGLFEVMLADGKLKAKSMYGETTLAYCEKAVFALSEDKTSPLSSTMIRFFVRGGKAWAAYVGSRMYQRIEG